METNKFSFAFFTVIVGVLMALAAINLLPNNGILFIILLLLGGVIFWGIYDMIDYIGRK